MYAICADCHTPHKLPESTNLEAHPCEHCGGVLINAEAVLCPECFRTAQGFRGRIHFIPKGTRSWTCPKGHHNQRARLPGAPVWRSIER